MKDNNKFNFFVPIEFEKGEVGSTKPLKIKGICSSLAEDSDGETLEPMGFDFKPLLERGYLNWNHQGNKTSSAIIGRPTMAKVINDGKDFYIEGYLYKGLEEAQSVYNLARVLEEEDPERRLGFSIEGQAMERDILNPKRIKKARITGVAITACPKNPNTLLSIIKGEYSESFVEEGEKECPNCTNEPIVNGKCAACGYEEKAMTAESGVGTTSVESVEGGQNKIKTFLRKSEVYNSIVNKYNITDIEKAKSIYTFIEKVNQKIFNMNPNEITQEAIEKSFSVLDSQFELEKSENSKEEKEEKEGKVEETPAEEASEKEEVSKAYEMAKDCIAKGMTKEAAMEDMIRKGLGLVECQTAVEKVISEAESLKENGGEITAVTKSEETTPLTAEVVVTGVSETPVETVFDMTIVKSEISTLISDKLSSNEESLNTIVKSLSTDLQGRFSALGNILKSSFEKNDEILKQVDSLVKSNEILSSRLEEIENTPAGRRAVTSARVIEREFEKSEANGIDLNSPDTYQLSKSEDVNALTDRLFKDYEVIKSRGREDEMLFKGIQNLEISRSIDGKFMEKLKGMGITVVK